MAETYVTAVTFGNDVITTTVTSSGQAVERWIAEILSVHRPGGTGYNIAVGLDVEWRPSYRADQNPVATLQLCVERSCLIFQLLYADYLPGALADFLGDRGIRFFGVGVEADTERLSDDHGLQVGNAVDLRGRAAECLNRPDLRQAGLRALVQAVMGVDLVKPQRVTMSRWDAYCLSNEQIRTYSPGGFTNFLQSNGSPENFHLVGNTTSRTTISPIASSLKRTLESNSQDKETINVDADETNEDERTERRLNWTKPEDVRLMMML